MFKQIIDYFKNKKIEREMQELLDSLVGSDILKEANSKKKEIPVDNSGVCGKCIFCAGVEDYNVMCLLKTINAPRVVEDIAVVTFIPIKNKKKCDNYVSKGVKL